MGNAIPLPSSTTHPWKGTLCLLRKMIFLNPSVDFLFYSLGTKKGPTNFTVGCQWKQF